MVTQSTKDKIVYLLLMVVVSLIPLRSLLHPGMFNSHDGEIHIARLASFYKSFWEGNIFPRWGANFNNNLGNPTLMFLYPLPNYLGLPFISLGFSFIDSVKILFVLSYVLSGIFMFLFLSNLFGGFASFFGTTLYLFSPYRFVNIYIRGALPEHIFFMLAPLSLLLFFKYLQKPSRLRLITVSLSIGGLILCNAAAAFIFLPFMLLVLIVITKPKLAQFFLPFALGLILSFYYWFPAIIETKYTNRSIVMSKEYSISHLFDLNKLIFPSWGYSDPRFENGLSVQIGVLNIFVLVICPFVLLIFRRIKKFKTILIYLYLTLLASIFLMLKLSRIVWISNSFFSNIIIFPWRLLILIVFVSSIIGSILIFSLDSKKLNVKNKALITFLAILISIGLTFKYQKAQGYYYKESDYYLNRYRSYPDNGESLPIWTPLEVPNTHKYPLEIIEGQAQITNILRKSELHKYLVDVEKDGTNFLENTLYFPGWNIYDNGINITHLVEYQDPHYKGLITFKLNKGKHEIVLRFENTKVRELAKIVTITGLLLLLLPIKIRFLDYKYEN